jgi:hypothetical protein
VVFSKADLEDDLERKKREKKWRVERPKIQSEKC